MAHAVMPTAEPKAVRLTRRECEVLKLVSKGMGSQEVADALFVSKRTVDFHLARVYDKLHVHNRLQATNAAVRLGLISQLGGRW